MEIEFRKQSQSIADSSGFPLQIRIAQLVNYSSNWRVWLEEHPWRTKENNSEGFIDIIIVERNNYVQHMVIECKRLRDTAWIFLISNPNQVDRAFFRVWYSSFEPPKWSNFGWMDCQAYPSSFESMFCAIKGQEHGRKTILEKISSELIESIEALAIQDKIICECDPPSDKYFRKIYIPVIITTAELRVGCFDPSEISLTDGSVPKDTIFSTVPYVRFRKSLTSFKSEPSRSLKEMHGVTERTIFIVNAENFPTFLQSWEIN